MSDERLDGVAEAVAKFYKKLVDCGFPTGESEQLAYLTGLTLVKNLYEVKES